MAEFEGQSLHVVRLQAIVVIDDIIVGGTNSPPVSSLTDQVEVIPAEKREWRKGVTKQGQTETIHYACLQKVSLGAGRFVREPSTCCVCKPDTLSWVL